jgi:hypothetical protein
MFQQLKLSNFLKRKGDNDDAVTGASKQSKSSSIDDVEIVHATPLKVQYFPLSFFLESLTTLNEIGISSHTCKCLTKFTSH